MACAFVRLSLVALPDRRLSSTVLVWLTLLLTGKFLVKELAFGQFNLPLGLLLVGAVIAAQHGRGLAAGAAIAAGVFVKPYALVLVPWLARTFGWRPFVPFALVMAAGLLLPALTYGWDGNLTLLHEWYRTVTDTTAPNLLVRRQHLVRLDVGEVDRAWPSGQHALRSLRRWPPSRRAALSCCGAGRWPNRTTWRRRTSAC